jgi:hypothetical protein
MKKKFGLIDFAVLLLTLLIVYGLLRRYIPEFMNSFSSGISVTAIVGRNVILVMLFLYLLINIFTDIFLKRVYNIFAVIVIIFGLVANFIFNGPSFFLSCLLGAFTGFVIFLLPFLVDTKIGAYVKTLTAIGALMGVKFMLWTTLFILILSELVRLIFKIRQKGFRETFRKLNALKDESTIFRQEEDILRSENLNIIPFGLTVLLSVLMTFYFIL